MIREVSVEDLDKVYEIEIKSFNLPWSKVSLEAELYKDYSKFYLYHINSIIVGYIIIWNLGEESEIITLAVSEDFRGNGIAKALLDYVINNSSSKRWFLEVNCLNNVAIKLYKKKGFIIAGQIKNYYGNNLDGYRMLYDTSYIGV